MRLFAQELRPVLKPRSPVHTASMCPRSGSNAWRLYVKLAGSWQASWAQGVLFQHPARLVGDIQRLLSRSADPAWSLHGAAVLLKVFVGRGISSL